MNGCDPSDRDPRSSQGAGIVSSCQRRLAPWAPWWVRRSAMLPGSLAPPLSSRLPLDGCLCHTVAPTLRLSPQGRSSPLGCRAKRPVAFLFSRWCADPMAAAPATAVDGELRLCPRPPASPRPSPPRSLPALPPSCSLPGCLLLLNRLTCSSESAVVRFRARVSRVRTAAPAVALRWASYIQVLPGHWTPADI